MEQNIIDSLDNPKTLFNILTWPKRIAQSRIKINVSIPGEPLSKQRPRFSISKSGQVYTPRQTRESEEWIGWRIKEAYRELIPDDLICFGVRIIFYQGDHQRRDIDNMSKLIFDACTGVVWKDDSQVIELISHVFRDNENPRTDLCIYSLGITDYPTQNCLVCGKSYRVYPSWKGKKVYCSQKCHSIGVRSGLMKKCAYCGNLIYRSPHKLEAKQFFCSMKCLLAYKEISLITLTCTECGREFKRAKSLIKRNSKPFCSEACMATYRRKRGIKLAKGICQQCGQPTSKKQYKLCRACFIGTKKFRYPRVDKSAPMTIIELRGE